MGRAVGKWDGVPGIGGTRDTPTQKSSSIPAERKADEGVRQEDRNMATCSIIADSDVHTTNNVTTNTDLVDLYMVQPMKPGKTTQSINTIPFTCRIQLRQNQGDQGTSLSGLFDSGAMINAISKEAYQARAHTLGPLRPSQRRLRMADGTLVQPVGVWKGTIQVASQIVPAEFEIFDCSSGWSTLIGKDLLGRLGVVQDYELDTVTLKHTGEKLRNEMRRAKDREESTLRPTLAIELQRYQTARRKGRTARRRQRIRESQQLEETIEAVNQVSEIGVTIGKDRFAPERVQQIVDKVQIGPDLTVEQRTEVENLIREFADCFALSVDEVQLVPGAQHRMNIPESVEFPKKAPYRKILSHEQRNFLHKTMQEWLEAGIVERLWPEQVKCCSPITLAPKEHSSSGTSVEQLRAMVNEQCKSAGINPPFATETSQPNTEHETGQTGPKERKWRICINYSAINKVTEVFPFPQGDIRAKQQRLSGHRWICQLDFASGFYALEVPIEARPYLAYFVEGLGYFAPIRMPFGATGAPSSFSHAFAENLADVVHAIGMELFVDDAGLANNNFPTMLTHLRKFFQRVRERRLSISPSKTHLFATKVVFAGSLVGPDGVQPNPAKVAAIVHWEQPQDLRNLTSFLGLTGYFRDLIQGYAKIAQPLTDLLRQAGITKAMSKQAYRNTLQNFKLTASRWGTKETKAFLALKTALTREPVLRAPVFDGTPFIITTDGCKDGFGATLSQVMESTLPGGEIVKRRHPIAFASKRTSTTEEKYPPFLLEFAALKFALDQFGDIVWGSPVELETDCQALKDVVTNPNLSTTYARWQDCILAHNIVAVRHIPGTTNMASDALSRSREGIPRQTGDGSEETVQPEWDPLVAGVQQNTTEEEPEQANAMGVRRQLCKRFQNEKPFLEATMALLPTSTDNNRQRKHKAAGYWVKDGRLWTGCQVPGHTFLQRECIPREEAAEMARKEHDKLHMGRDVVKTQLARQIACPGLDDIITNVIRACGRCNHFGPTHIHAKLQPITRRRPFELLVGDYLSMPPGKGGFTKIALFADVFSRHLFAFKYKLATGATTVTSLRKIIQAYTPFAAFMSDGGTHFDCTEVRDFCETTAMKHIITPPYAPWVNGLLEGSNRILLNALKRRCAPHDFDTENTEHLMRAWPEHLDETIAELNSRILPSLLKSPKELLLSLYPSISHPTPEPETWADPSIQDAQEQAAVATLACLDGYNATMQHMERRRTTFNRQLETQHPREVTFAEGQLVQIHRTDLVRTVSNERKLTPMWSRPHRVVRQVLNSYELETLEGVRLSPLFHARRLRAYAPATVVAGVLSPFFQTTHGGGAVSRRGGPGPGGPEGEGTPRGSSDGKGEVT